MLFEYTKRLIEEDVEGYSGKKLQCKGLLSDWLRGTRLWLVVPCARIAIPAQCFEDIPDYLEEKDWIKLGAIHQKSNEDTLDTFIKKYTNGTSAVSYVAPILEKANIAIIDRKKPAKIKLKK